ncbi:hypothetical protein TNCT_70361 [Trichonephila clavata]|uniref:Secreted protein n=1 Tax=Trichonephila clavata TaxID=2740835 RepID=A0A8X6FBU4_TRICU|nr:hypothetical protein TNCT_70361 [Trichonephila clavata]
MIRFSIQVLVLSVIAVSSVIAINGYDNDFTSFDIKTDQCISQSGNQERCDNYIACKKSFPSRCMMHSRRVYIKPILVAP